MTGVTKEEVARSVSKGEVIGSPREERKSKGLQETVTGTSSKKDGTTSRKVGQTIERVDERKGESVMGRSPLKRSGDALNGTRGKWKSRAHNSKVNRCVVSGCSVSNRR